MELSLASDHFKTLLTGANQVKVSERKGSEEKGRDVGEKGGEVKVKVK